MTLQAGQVLGRFRIDGLLTEGGLERAYRATADDGTLVVVKVPRFETDIQADLMRRFTRQAQTASRVAHPRVVAVYESGQLDGGVPYVVEEYVDGGSLKDLMAQRRIDVGTAVKICADVAEGLDALHAARIIHRSLTPACVLLDGELRAKVGGFALAKDRDASNLTRAGHTVGAAQYIAPEQIRGEELSPAADVYALGCVLFAALTGEPPFASQVGMKLLWAHMQSPPPDPRTIRPEIPAELSWTMARALAKSPDDRPASAGTLARLVQISWDGAGLRGRRANDG